MTVNVRVEFEYDYMSRRISKTVGRRTGGGLWQLMGETSFLYDGWNVVSEICDDQSQITTNFYVWGLDLSGSLQGAGGIGGLLAAQLGTNSVFYTYDGNGNVSELINTLDGTIAAHYEYSPFGEVLVATGDLAGDNPFQFSTKYFDSETGLNNYGYRYYSPSLGRWVSRDPIGEEAFLRQFIVGKSRKEKKHWRNLSQTSVYGYVNNSPTANIDPFGLDLHSNCGRQLWARAENDWYPVDPGDDVYGDVDGVSWSNWGDHAGLVYKVVDCYDTTVTCNEYTGECGVELKFVGQKNCSYKTGKEYEKCMCRCRYRAVAFLGQQTDGGWRVPSDIPWSNPPPNPDL